jgi:hypothetical protein
MPVTLLMALVVVAPTYQSTIGTHLFIFRYVVFRRINWMIRPEVPIQVFRLSKCLRAAVACEWLRVCAQVLSSIHQTMFRFIKSRLTSVQTALNALLSNIRIEILSLNFHFQHFAQKGPVDMRDPGKEDSPIGPLSSGPWCAPKLC